MSTDAEIWARGVVAGDCSGQMLRLLAAAARERLPGSLIPEPVSGKLITDAARSAMNSEIGAFSGWIDGYPANWDLTGATALLASLTQAAAFSRTSPVLTWSQWQAKAAACGLQHAEWGKAAQCVLKQKRWKGGYTSLYYTGFMCSASGGGATPAACLDNLAVNWSNNRQNPSSAPGGGCASYTRFYYDPAWNYYYADMRAVQITGVWIRGLSGITLNGTVSAMAAMYPGVATPAIQAYNIGFYQPSFGQLSFVLGAPTNIDVPKTQTADFFVPLNIGTLDIDPPNYTPDSSSMLHFTSAPFDHYMVYRYDCPGGFQFY